MHVTVSKSAACTNCVTDVERNLLCFSLFSVTYIVMLNIAKVLNNYGQLRRLQTALNTAPPTCLLFKPYIYEGQPIRREFRQMS